MAESQNEATSKTVLFTDVLSELQQLLLKALDDIQG